MNAKKTEQIVKACERLRDQTARRAAVKERLEANARDERKQIALCPRMNILDGGHR